MHKSKKKEIYQLKNIYESTTEFEKFINKNNGFSGIKNILDAGCGIGANSYYLSRKHPLIKITGGDYRKDNILNAQKILSKKKYPNIEFMKYDILKPSANLKNRFEGIICVHTFCCFKNSKPVIDKLCKLKPKWIAINSLFYNGPLDILIHIRDSNKGLKDKNPDGDFNMFSIPQIKNEFLQNGYKINFTPFFPKKKLKQPVDKSRGSYTIKTEFNKNTIFSGPVYLPWHFIFARKIK